MKLEPSICYRAVLARDARYDGRFFTCVKTTGIYCRPICPARPPKLQNCRFVPTAAAAQEAGFRPCLRCRPESSPDLDAWKGTSATVSRALKLIEGGALDDGDIATLADRLQIGDRQLRRLFRQHLGAAPVTVAQTRRVLLAKQLIHQTNLPMIDVALASGFGSVRRFNETFQALYHRPPGELRRGKSTPASSPEISLLLPYRPPYDWAAMIRFLHLRAITGLEVVTSNSYSRVIQLENTIGSITVCHAPAQSALQAIVRFPQLSALPVIIARIRRMFDLSADPGAIASVLSMDPVLEPLVNARPGLRVPGGWDGFEIAVRAVLGQQITVKAATQLATRIVSAFGTPLDDRTGLPGLTHAFPQPSSFDFHAQGDDMRSGRPDGVLFSKSQSVPPRGDRYAAMQTAPFHLGMPRSRAATLAGIAAAFTRDKHLFDPRSDLAETVARLRDLPGIGEWTAQYIAMRAMGESDAFLAADVAVQKKFAMHGRPLTAAPLLARAESWRPWRAYAVLHLWMADTAASQSQSTENHHALTA